MNKVIFFGILEEIKLQYIYIEKLEYYCTRGLIVVFFKYFTRD